MKAVIRLACIVLAFGGVALSADMSFEAASVKATPANAGPRDPMHVDSGRVTLNSMSLKLLIQMAYSLPEWKLDGVSGWIEDNRYDISAKFPQGAGEKQLPEMLRTLLHEWDGHGAVSGWMRPGHLVFPDMTIDGLAEVLATRVGKPVIDQTNIPGKYAIDLRWSAKEMDADGTSTDGPSIFTALEEQLGLTLRTTTAPVEVLAIRHAAPPSDN